MEGKGELAKSLFEQGYNCAQSVVAAFAQEMGMDTKTAARLVCGLGGGVGRQREICGAVSGMAVVAGFLYGYDTPGDEEGKRRTYEMVQLLSARFREKNGSILCRELLGEEGKDTNFVPSARTAEYYARRPCPGLIFCAGQLLEEYCRERDGGESNGEHHTV